MLSFCPNRFPRCRWRKQYLTFQVAALALFLFVVGAWNIASAYLYPSPLPEQRRLLSLLKADSCDGKFEGDLKPLALVVYSLALIILFVGIANVTDDYFVPALEVMSERLDLTE